MQFLLHSALLDTCSCLQTPPVGAMLELCMAIESFLEQQPSSVAVVCCSGTCAATHILLSAYLLLKVRSGCLMYAAWTWQQHRVAAAPCD